MTPPQPIACTSVSTDYRRTIATESLEFSKQYKTQKSYTRGCNAVGWSTKRIQMQIIRGTKFQGGVLECVRITFAAIFKITKSGRERE